MNMNFTEHYTAVNEVFKFPIWKNTFIPLSLVKIWVLIVSSVATLNEALAYTDFKEAAIQFYLLNAFGCPWLH